MPGQRLKAVDFFDDKEKKAEELILGGDLSDDDVEVEEDDEFERPKARTNRNENDDDSDDEDDNEEEDDIDGTEMTPIDNEKNKKKSASMEVDDSNDKELQEIMTGKKAANTNHRVKPISQKQLEKNLMKIKNSGVVYISRVPPFMKPAKMKSIMSRFGEVNRIFLAPEDPKSRMRRIKSGGNKKVNYTEGWVEFVKKRHAKLAAETLNGNIIGGKKGNYYHDDVLSVKYLHNFKWNNLTEQIALEAQSRQEKLKAEIAQATAENKAFIEGVEKQKMLERRGQTSSGIKRSFDQRDVNDRRAGSSKKSKKDPEGSLSNVLGKIF